MTNKKHFLLIAALVSALVIQWYVPLSMIVSAEKVLSSGTLYRFRTAPIDPVDYFRGRYLVLNFEEDEAFPGDDYAWDSAKERAYVTLSADAEGFARFERVYRERPASGEDYIEVLARKHWDREKEGLLQLELPVDRFYMEEFKAPKAEEFYNSVMQDRNGGRQEKEAWVEAKVLDGRMIVEELVVGNRPIREWLEEEVAREE